MSKTARPQSYTEIQITVGKRMRWAREYVQPNLAAFARELGVDPSTLHKIEDGKCAPSMFIVIGYANRLRITADFILRGRLLGVDPELLEKLLLEHPELRTRVDGSGSNPLAGRGRESDTPP